MPTASKAALEDLLRSHRLRADAPPLRGETRFRPLSTGIVPLDALLAGGFPRGQLSEIHGPVSSGRTGIALGLVAHATRCGALAAWVDPVDRLDPASALKAGVNLARLLWLRGGRCGRLVSEALSASGTLLSSGLFEVVVLDFAGIPASELRRLPGTTWTRLQRVVEAVPTALVLLGDAHLAQGPLGVTLALTGRPDWSATSGPGRLLRGLEVRACAGRHAVRETTFPLQAID